MVSGHASLLVLNYGAIRLHSHLWPAPAQASWRAGAQDRPGCGVHLSQPRWSQGHRGLHFLQQYLVQPQRAPTARDGNATGQRTARHRETYARKKISRLFSGLHQHLCGRSRAGQRSTVKQCRQETSSGLSIGTRPDCVSPQVLDLLAGYQAQGQNRVAGARPAVVLRRDSAARQPRPRIERIP